MLCEKQQHGLCKYKLLSVCRQTKILLLQMSYAVLESESGNRTYRWQDWSTPTQWGLVRINTTFQWVSDMTMDRSNKYKQLSEIHSVFVHSLWRGSLYILLIPYENIAAFLWWRLVSVQTEITVRSIGVDIHSTLRIIPTVLRSEKSQVSILLWHSLLACAASYCRLLIGGVSQGQR